MANRGGFPIMAERPYSALLVLCLLAAASATSMANRDRIPNQPHAAAHQEGRALAGVSPGVFTPATADQMVAALVVPGDFAISGATFAGDATQGGLIDLTASDHTLKDSIGRGLVLSNGDAATAALVANTAPDATGNKGTAGTPFIGNSFDAAILEFTLTPTGSGTLGFQYVWVSEQYPDFVDLGFNDQFLLLVNGVNVATLPGTSTRVGIDNVNANTNSAFFVDNVDGNFNTEYDGLTVLLTTAATPVTANQPLLIQLIVADVGDTLVDSAVYIKAASFSLTLPPTAGPTTAPTTAEPTAEPTPEPTPKPTLDSVVCFGNTPANQDLFLVLGPEARYGPPSSEEACATNGGKLLKVTNNGQLAVTNLFEQCGVATAWVNGAPQFSTGTPGFCLYYQAKFGSCKANGAGCGTGVGAATKKATDPACFVARPTLCYIP